MKKNQKSKIKNQKLKKGKKRITARKKIKVVRKTAKKKKAVKKVVATGMVRSAKRKIKAKKRIIKKVIRKKTKGRIPLGGMAFANGIMLRTKNNMAIVMADDAGRVELISFKLKNIRDKFRFLFIPFVRGISFLIENIYFFLKISWYKRPFVKKTLKQKTRPERLLDRIGQYIVYLVYLFLLVGLFDYLYIRLNIDFNLTGIYSFSAFLLTFLYICMFAVLFFLVAISRREELNIFAYHGAEHKIIDAYESGSKMDATSIKKMNLINKRCAIAIFFWAAVVLSLLVTFLKLNEANWLLGLLVTIGLIFASFSISYELTRLAYIGKSNFLQFIFIKPLYLIQAILTHNPDEKHLKVGLIAFEEVMKLEKER
ncbi:MAG: DUF1385 domain-containing protein [Patescibacteria group bacterium]|nr:DUF1385 domain-containing protein [Patescibacteria group bacterium]